MTSSKKLASGSGDDISMQNADLTSSSFSYFDTKHQPLQHSQLQGTYCCGASETAGMLGWERHVCATVSMSSFDNSSMPRIAMMFWRDL